MGYTWNQTKHEGVRYRVILQGIDHANNGLDGVKAGIEIALRAFSLARKGGTRQA
jgi:hypothetical protein